MSEEPQVISVRDDGERKRWGFHKLFFRDGAKWTVRKRTVALVFGQVFITLAILQMIFVDPAGPENGPKASLPLGQPEGRESIQLDRFKPEGKISVSRSSAPTALAPLKGPQLISRKSSLRVPPGAIVDAKLVTGASNGVVQAVVTESFRFNGELLIEEGTTFVGQGSSTEERLNVTFTQAVARDGSVTTIQAHACDVSDRIVGLKGSKLGNKAVNIAGGIGLGFLGGFSEGLQDSEAGRYSRTPSIKNALLNATAATALEQSKNLMSELKERTPVVEVPAGQPICVIFLNGGKD